MLIRGDRPTIGWWRRHPGREQIEYRARLAALIYLGSAEGAAAVLGRAQGLREVA